MATPTFTKLGLLDCYDCKMEVSPASLNSTGVHTCTHCHRAVSVRVFPALVRESKGDATPDSQVIATESSCFYHPTKTATVICDECGRFLCKLCDIALLDQHRCPGCMENVTANKSNKTAVRRYIHYDSISLYLAVGGMLFGFLSFITASASLYYVIRHWKSPHSILPRTRWRFVLAAIISLSTLALWGFFILALIADTSV